MRFLVFTSVVLGVACATPFLPRDDPNVAAARASFIQEYNRLAAIAAAAPDVNIIMDDRPHPSIANNNLHQRQHTPQLPVVRHQQQPSQAVSHRQPPQPTFHHFSYSTTHGNKQQFSPQNNDNQQFFPKNNNNQQLFPKNNNNQQFFPNNNDNRQFSPQNNNNQQFFPQNNFIQPVAAAAPERQHHNSGRHLAGHLADHHFPITPTRTLKRSGLISESSSRWTGPLADTVPAGLNGLPRQVTDTPEVAAAKAAHNRIHALAKANNPVF